MDINSQYYKFYRTELKKICQSIRMGRVLTFVGMNSLGKTLLINQVLSERFKDEYLKDEKTHIIFLEFKDKQPPTPAQLYQYWLTETAKVIGYTLPNESLNDYSFYFHLMEMAKTLGDKKLVYLVLDAQNILSQGEPFYRSLIYLHRYTYKKISYILFSEPHILDCSNVWVQRFLQDLTNYKFNFLRLFDKDTVTADIQREEGLLKANLKDRRNLIIKYGGGLHGVIGALSYILHKNRDIKDIRSLRKIVEKDQMCEYWFNDIFKSLPAKSLRILKEIVQDPGQWKKYRDDVYGNYLVELGFLKRDGVFRHLLMISFLTRYNPSERGQERKLKFANNQFYLSGERVKLTKKEKRILELLYKSRGKLVSYDRIGEMVWDDNVDDFSLWAIAQIVRRLRRKLVSYSLPPQTIQSVRGEGYVFGGI